MKDRLPWWLVVPLGWIVIAVATVVTWAAPALTLATGDTGILAGPLGLLLLASIWLVALALAVQVVRVGPILARSLKLLCGILLALALIPLLAIIAQYLRNLLL